MTLPPPKICQPIRKLDAQIGSSSKDAEVAREKLNQTLAEFGLSWNDLPRILGADINDTSGASDVEAAAAVPAAADIPDLPGLIPAPTEEHVGTTGEECLAIPVARVFENQRWPLSIASAWVLSRNKEFVASCVRPNEPEDLGVGPVRTEAYNWRWDVPINGKQLGRRPVMLFPTVEAAAERLQRELTPTSTGLFERAEVLARFPQLATGDCPSPSAWDSVWKGIDPRSQERLTFSHAGWWIASEQGARIFPLDDHASWKPALDELLAAVVDDTAAIFSVDSQGAQRLSGKLFCGVLVDYPAYALRFPWRRGHDLFVECDLLNLEGDQYFSRGAREPAWRGLQVADLLKMYGRRRTGSVGRPTSMDLIEKQLDDRISALHPGEYLSSSVVGAATSLSEWLARTHPNEPPCTAKTIRNRLREKILPHISRN
jgi:hypothetical protein